MTRISVVTGCLNEEENVRRLYEAVKAVFAGFEELDYEHIFIDNASTDRTVEELRALAAADQRVKVIVNNRNFGHIRSPYHAIFQASGDAVITMAADFQDPPELIAEFIRSWREGYQVVIGIKQATADSLLFGLVRRGYYRLIDRLSEVDLVRNFTGFGLYDREVIEALRQIDDPYPYFRGLICDLGFSRKELPFVQPPRARGFTKNNVYTLYDLAMLGITNHSKVPLRLATMLGFLSALISFLAALGYLVYKLVYWNQFSVGIAPVVIGLFFFGSIQLLVVGILGEYVGAIHTQVLKRPLVVERERINFNSQAPPRASSADQGAGAERASRHSERGPS